MKKSTARFGMVFMLSVGALSGQTADISLPKQRETTVLAAEKLLASRSDTIKQNEDTVSPFTWPAANEKADTQEVLQSAPAATPGANTAEFLSKLAAQIPATGIAFIGDQGILLLGQKRLKVGDVVMISFEGQNYEVSIAAISSASFTVKRGGLLHTRPTLIASPTSRNIRQ
jgi:hypothetical protein